MRSRFVSWHDVILKDLKTVQKSLDIEPLKGVLNSNFGDFSTETIDQNQSQYKEKYKEKKEEQLKDRPKTGQYPKIPTRKFQIRFTRLENKFETNSKYLSDFLAQKRNI